ncbi:MAG: hypothetical protein DI537_42690 [Stutzerimonas stutzeri]|nr:MAG: hypothetical protein DI537_42690 [Stutzerimonas stutzeri]
MHKSNRKQLPAVIERVFAARLSGAKTREDLLRLDISDEEIAAAKPGVDAKIAALESQVFDAWLRGARKEPDYLGAGFSAEELALASPGVARRVRETEQVAA